MQELKSTEYAAQTEQIIVKLKRSEGFKEWHEFY